MNSISDLHLSSGAKLVLYANDILLYKPINLRNDALLLQYGVNLILHWIHDQGLTPNHSKTGFLQDTRSNNVPTVNKSIDGHPLTENLWNT